MPIQLTSLNVVVTAAQLNPAIVSETWLAAHNVMAAGDFVGTRMCTGVFSTAENNVFSLVVIAERLQFVSKNLEQGCQPLVQACTNFVNALPETPYTAVGLNYGWTVIPPAGSNAVDLSRALFLHSGSFCDAVAGNDAVWGVSVVRAAFGGICRMGVNPRYADPHLRGQPDTLIAEFNYNFPVENDNRVGQVLAALGQAQATMDDASRITESLLV
jgi:hypothetical protein